AETRKESMVITTIGGMPPGTIGLRASGKLTEPDYTGVAIPPLPEALDPGERNRLLLEGPWHFAGRGAGPVKEELNADLGLGLGHLRSWDRMAVVSDKEWLANAIALFGWMVPGSIKRFPLSALDEAKAWLSA